VALAREAGDRRIAALAQLALGDAAADRDDLDAAEARCAEGLAQWRDLGGDWGTWGMAYALQQLGGVAQLRGDLDAAAAAYEESLALRRRVGDRTGTGHALLYLNEVARLRGDLATAEACGRAALAVYWELGSVVLLTSALTNLALTAAAGGQAERAARLLGATQALHQANASTRLESESADWAREVIAARATLGEESWDATFAAGTALALEEAVAEALGESSPIGERR
jgi:hypothetical protein